MKTRTHHQGCGGKNRALGRLRAAKGTSILRRGDPSAILDPRGAPNIKDLSIQVYNPYIGIYVYWYIGNLCILFGARFQQSWADSYRCPAARIGDHCITYLFSLRESADPLGGGGRLRLVSSRPSRPVRPVPSCHHLDPRFYALEPK